jgi:ABC-type lipopolysaccharide export system ATPase subunit
MHTLEVDSVSLRFGERRILTDIYLRCETGKVTGLLGRNGSGKTCLMNIIYGSLKGENQHLSFDNEYIEEAFRKPGLIAYLPQFSFIPRRLKLSTVFRHFQLDMDAFVHHFPEFGNCRNERVGNLSGGQSRLLEIFTVLHVPAKFVMLDEPYSHIMPLHVEQLQQLIRLQAASRGILLSDHLYKPVLEISDDLYVLNDGKAHLTRSDKDVVRLGYLLRL